ncbi:hypothetical protein HGRIS_007095 [Hohenbuehelia grisea]|uniref:Uncharacterized protein n=1 Tax=Hohenbuehelia grisea TaxID=104357 RepID=A0ABR3JB05_9AGAR
MRHSRPAFSAFLILLYRCWSGEAVAHGSQVNITMDDTDPSILYMPSSSWHSSSVPCSFCLSPDPNLAYQKTYHDGTHIVPTVDGDDNLPTSSATVASSSQAPRSSAPPAAPKQPDTDDDDDNDDDKGGGKGKGGSRLRLRFRKRDDVNPFFTDKLDADDVGFVDAPVSVQFQFTGSAVYLYGLLPQATAMPNQTPTTMNLTFTLDDQPMTPYTHSGALSESTYVPNVNVFAASGLADSPHNLRVDIGPDSVFLFDYMIYTQSAEEAASHSTTAPGVQLTSSSPSSTEDASEKRHNIATFAGAVGGSVGVLGVLALGIAISLIRRRRAAARRDRRDREASLHTNASEDSPPMQGPAPFVPRYFPGTVPAAPPPYVPRSPSPASSSSSHSLSMSMVPESLAASAYVARPPSFPTTAPSMTTASTYTPLLSSLALSSQPGTHALTYADLPPATPPLEDGTVLPTPPPSFGEAIATGVPARLEFMAPPGISLTLPTTVNSITPSSPVTESGAEPPPSHSPRLPARPLSPSSPSAPSPPPRSPRRTSLPLETPSSPTAPLLPGRSLSTASGSNLDERP